MTSLRNRVNDLERLKRAQRPDFGPEAAIWQDRLDRLTAEQRKRFMALSIKLFFPEPARGPDGQDRSMQDLAAERFSEAETEEFRQIYAAMDYAEGFQ